MKKLLAVFALCLGMTAANAQVEYATKDSKLFWDNWYASLNIGAQTPLKGNLISNTRFNWGVEAGRYITPVFGLGAEYRMAVNTTPSCNVFDQTNLTGLMKFNLTNLIYGYTGEPKFFELVANYGIGWGHNYVCNWVYNYTTEPQPWDVEKDLYVIKPVSDKHGWDMNYLTSKMGLEFNFNLDAEKAWQVNVKPSVVWAMHNNFYEESSAHGYQLNGNQAALELVAGVTYKFGNSNGTHNFVRAQLRDQNEIDGLNGQIDDLKSQLADKDAQLKAANDRIAADAQRLKDLENQLGSVKCDPELETIVSFACASSKIANTQIVNVERVAQFLKANEGAKVTVKGYASPEGNLNFNQKLSERRANAVKDMLIKKFGIDESRISVEGCGIGNIFDTPKLNRVAINFAK